MLIHFSSTFEGGSLEVRAVAPNSHIYLQVIHSPIPMGKEEEKQDNLHYPISHSFPLLLTPMILNYSFTDPPPNPRIPIYHLPPSRTPRNLIPLLNRLGTHSPCRRCAPTAQPAAKNLDRRVGGSVPRVWGLGVGRWGAWRERGKE